MKTFRILSALVAVSMLLFVAEIYTLATVELSLIDQELHGMTCILSGVVFFVSLFRLRLWEVETLN